MKTIAQLNARSVILAKSSKTLADNIHSHLVDITEHFKTHGDATAMTMLHEILHSATRKNAIKAWAEAFSGMKFVAESKKDGKVKPAHFIRNKNIPFDQIDLEAAAETSPWDFSPEPKFVPFDLDKAIAALIKKAEAAADDERNTVPADKLQKLAELKA